MATANYKGLGISLPNALIYVVLIYAGYVVLKPLIAASTTTAEAISIPGDILGGIDHFIRNIFGENTSGYYGTTGRF